MNELQIGLLIVVVTTAVLFSGFPIAWGLTLVSVVFLVAFKGPASLQILANQFMDELNSFALLTIPLFVLLGASIGVSAASKDIYESMYRWLSRVPGSRNPSRGVFAPCCQGCAGGPHADSRALATSTRPPRRKSRRRRPIIVPLPAGPGQVLTKFLQ